MKILEKMAMGAVVRQVKKGQNTDMLISYLRNGKEVTPELSHLIADLLEGKIKAKPKGLLYKPSKPTLEREISGIKDLIKNGGSKYPGAKDITLEDVKIMLRAGEYKDGYPEKKGEITIAARMIVARLYGLTDSQLDEILYQRRSRQKNA